MNFFLFGLNHKTAPVEVRERLAISPQEVENLVLTKRAELCAGEILVLSTCNRTEIYGTHEKCRAISEEIRGALLDFKGINGRELPDNCFYYAEDEEAVRHLFKVSAGIDSLIVGENQILGQVKEAYTISTKTGTNGPMINRIFHQAFRVGKRARSETKLGEGIVSTSHAAVLLAKKIFSDLSDKKILLVGAGETGELALRHFAKEGIGKVFVTNRSADKALELSKRVGGTHCPFESFREILSDIDIAIFSTSSEKFLITAKDGAVITGGDRTKPLFIIDISVPRNVDPKISEVENIFLYDIDDLEAIVEENVKLRCAEIKNVEGIVAEEIAKYREWIRNLQFEPLLKFLKEEFETIRLSEVSKSIRKFEGKSDEVDMLTRSIVNKIVNRPLQKLRRFDINTHAYILRSALLEELFKDEKDK